jgi:antibiotic biosynthesis monooxygenase (ABM) superfamily enzyme
VTPPRHKVAVLTWLAIYPTVTGVSAVIESVGPAGVPLPLRTLTLTVIVVPTVVFLLAPALSRLLGPWLRSKGRAPNNPASTPLR